MQTTVTQPSALGAAQRIDGALDSVRALGIPITSQDRIADYLRDHDKILPFLPSLASAVVQSFPDCHVALEFFTSQNGSDSYLVFFLRHHHYPDGFMSKIRRFREESGHLFAFSDGWLAVTTDFQPPPARV